MLDPTPLPGTLRFTPTGRGRVAGRETITADAVPRLSGRRERPHMFELSQLGGGADRYALQVDAERGVLLEAAAFRDGESFQRITTEQVTFDHAIDPERFRFAPPVGEEIQPPWVSTSRTTSHWRKLNSLHRSPCWSRSRSRRTGARATRSSSRHGDRLRGVRVDQLPLRRRA